MSKIAVSTGPDAEHLSVLESGKSLLGKKDVHKLITISNGEHFVAEILLEAERSPLLGGEDIGTIVIYPGATRGISIEELLPPDILQTTEGELDTRVIFTYGSGIPALCQTWEICY